MAFQIRASPVLRSVNLRTGASPGMLFQICRRRALGQLADRAASSAAAANRTAPSLRLAWAHAREAYAVMWLSAVRTKAFMRC